MPDPAMTAVTIWLGERAQAPHSHGGREAKGMQEESLGAGDRGRTGAGVKRVISRPAVPCYCRRGLLQHVNGDRKPKAIGEGE